ncbi:MAG: amidase [Sphingomonadales bacterium]|nr:amidase [Sphingomonadales bacterium]MDE2168912.1 amidase [Sphingomonadales bacterium]
MRHLSVLFPLSLSLAMLSAATLAQAAPALPQQGGEDGVAMAADMAAGRTSSERLTRAALDRIAALDRKGPTLRAVIAVNPDALAQARAADLRRKQGHMLGPLDGLPVLVKDNIETKDPMATTAGSLALVANVTGRDAPVVARLRAGGAVILGKTNLSEWANIRSTASVSGWSAVGGQAKNPYALDRTPCGSSSGSGVGVAAGYVPLALGTETDGSVVCPSSINGLVGLKPTLGLISRTHVVPISHSQDTPGPMARSVRDVAMMLGVIAGSDPADPATAQADARRVDYAASLAGASLKGVRLAVLRPKMIAPLAARYEAALAVLAAQGAVLVPVEQPKLEGLDEAEHVVLMTELKGDLNAYLATTPAAVRTRSLNDLVAFNKANAAQEMPYFAQESFIEAQAAKGEDDAEYLGMLAKSRRLAGAEGIDAMLKTAQASMLIEPTYGPGWLIDPVYGDGFEGPSASQLPAVSGYPDLTVPMGLVRGLPVGLSFIARPYQDAMLLGAGYVYEQASHARVEPRFLPQADVGPGQEGMAAK